MMPFSEKTREFKLGDRVRIKSMNEIGEITGKRTIAKYYTDFMINHKWWDENELEDLSREQMLEFENTL